MESKYLLGITIILWTHSSCLERPVTYTPDGCIWTQFVKTQASNSLSIQPTPAVNVSDCQSICRSTFSSWCNGIDWNIKSECRFLSATTTKTKNTNSTHYELTCITDMSRENYIGCYKLTNLTALQNSANLTIDSCINFCRVRSNTYAAMQGGHNCSCLDSVNTSYLMQECSTPCGGSGIQFCGGQKTIYSIYAVCPIGLYGFGCNFACHCAQQIPCDRNSGVCPNNYCDGKWTGASCNTSSSSERYIGCYRQFTGFLTTRLTRDISESNDDGYTSDTCSFYCIENNYQYIALSWWGQCFGGSNTNGATKASESDCNTPCDANKNEMCGGENRLSVYSACPAGNYGNNCYAKCNCLNNARCDYFSGYCPSGSCKLGWTGYSCNVRDCGRYNGDCSANQTCVQLNLYYLTNVARCMCLNGYQQINQWGQCTDLNECLLDEPVCNLSSSYCVNTIGSYNCACKNNYEAVNQRLCRDIDECARKTDICNHTISNCTNTDGGYNCTCMEGYTNENATICADLDECLLDELVCNASDNFYCVNTIGSYTCLCEENYETVNQTLCIDIDECSRKIDKCNRAISDCTNTDGGYICKCREGYASLNATICLDEDECSVGKAKCDKTSTICKDTEGSYECICKSRFESYNETTCTDIDECSNGESKCDNSTSTCRNTFGDYTCDCNDGYIQEASITCSEISIDRSFSLEVVIGTAIASSLGTAFIFVIITIVILIIRRTRRRRHLKKDSDASPSTANDTEIKESTHNDYETLQRRSAEAVTNYEELNATFS